MCSLGISRNYSIVRCSFCKVTIDVSHKICADRMYGKPPPSYILAGDRSSTAIRVRTSLCAGFSLLLLRHFVLHRQTKLDTFIRRAFVG
jgi:hypothetical protein